VVLLEVEHLSHNCAVGEEAMHQLNRPVEVNGLRAALFFTRAHARLYRPAVAETTAHGPPPSSRLGHQFQKLEDEIDNYVQKSKLVS
jgi:hypothetical protein